MANYFDDKECMPNDERYVRKTNNVIEMLNIGYQKSSRIQKIFAEMKIDYSELRTLHDFEQLPIISREKLR